MLRSASIQFRWWNWAPQDLKTRNHNPDQWVSLNTTGLNYSNQRAVLGIAGLISSLCQHPDLLSEIRYWNHRQDYITCSKDSWMIWGIIQHNLDHRAEIRDTTKRRITRGAELGWRESFASFESLRIRRECILLTRWGKTQQSSKRH